MKTNKNIPDFRQALSRFATGVTVITYRDASGLPQGLTVSSFNSLSLEPCLILWSIGSKSSHFKALQVGEPFVVNILSAEGMDHVMHFFGRKDNIFESIGFSSDQQGIPILDKVCAAFSCQVDNRVAAGDHDIIIGKVSDFSCTESDPLIFYAGKFLESGIPVQTP